MGFRGYIELKNNECIKYQNLWNTAKVLLIYLKKLFKKNDTLNSSK